ncbi:hypothetical protein Tco_1459055 [Tanacetum coccineum]
MCRQPLPLSLSPPSTKLMIMALEEYRYQIRRGIRVAIGDPYPRMYALETYKSVLVSSKLADTSLDSSFRRKPRGGVEQDQYDALSAQVHDVVLTPMADRWVWSLESLGNSLWLLLERRLMLKGSRRLLPRPGGLNMFLLRLMCLLGRLRSMRFRRDSIFLAVELRLIPSCVLYVLTGWNPPAICSSLVTWLSCLLAESPIGGTFHMRRSNHTKSGVLGS